MSDRWHNGRALDNWQRDNKRIQDAVTIRLDAEDKAREPLEFYWRKGVQHMRQRFRLPLYFKPKPEDFYNEGNYL